MSDWSRDAFHNVIVQGIFRDIGLTWSHGSIRACLILIYAGMDAMATLDMPDERASVSPADFMSWAGTYVRFPGAEQLTAQDLYSARNAIVHSYSSESKMTRNKHARIVMYVNANFRPVVTHPKHPDAVVVSVAALKEAFERGVERYFNDLDRDSKRETRAKRRLAEMIHVIPYQSRGEAG